MKTRGPGFRSFGGINGTGCDVPAEVAEMPTERDGGVMESMPLVPIPNGIDHVEDSDHTLDSLWNRLRRADWSSNAAAYATASDARRIIELTGMTEAAFAAECKARRINGFGSQGSVSRRLRWAQLHDDLWQAGILPAQVFLSEAATRPLFDGHLSKLDRLRLLSELFDPYLSDQQRRDLAESFNEEAMREYLRRAGAGQPSYRAPRRLLLEPTVRRLLVEGHSATEIADTAHRLADSARNAIG